MRLPLPSPGLPLPLPGALLLPLGFLHPPALRVRESPCKHMGRTIRGHQPVGAGGSGNGIQLPCTQERHNLLPRGPCESRPHLPSRRLGLRWHLCWAPSPPPPGGGWFPQRALPELVPCTGLPLQGAFLRNLLEDKRCGWLCVNHPPSTGRYVHLLNLFRCQWQRPPIEKSAG